MPKRLYSVPGRNAVAFIHLIAEKWNSRKLAFGESSQKLVYPRTLIPKCSPSRLRRPLALPRCAPVPVSLARIEQR